MDQHQFSIGDLVAHKAYPEKAEGRITKFHASGRVGVDNGESIRSFLPKNLVLMPSAPPLEVEELGDAIATDEVMEVPPVEVKNNRFCKVCGQIDCDLHERSKSYESDIYQCPRCGRRKFWLTNYDATDSDYKCQSCGYETILDGLEEISEVMEVPPVEVEESEDDDEPDPPCATSPTPPKPPTPPLPPAQEEAMAKRRAEGIAQSSLTEKLPVLLPVPRDFSELEQLPQWWERPILPQFERVAFDCDDDDDEDWDWLEDTGYFTATYRGWELVIWEAWEIFATPPNSDRLYHCECELDLDGPSGQIAIAQEFIDCWYFAQPSPGQLSLNFSFTVARAPPQLPAMA